MVFGTVHLDALRGETFDRRLRHVDQLHMGKVVGFEVSGIDAQALAAEDIVRAEQIGCCRILDDASNFAPRKVGDRVVGSFVKQKVAISSKEGQATAFPGLFILSLALFWARLQSRLHIERKIEAGWPRTRFGTQCRVVGLDGLSILRRQLLVPSWHGIGRRALEYGEG